MIESYYCEKYNRDVFGAFFTFTFPIISDSEVAIRKYLKYSDTKATNAFTTHFSKGLQSIITNNTADLAIRVAGLHKTGQKGWAKPFIGVAKAFEGFLENNLEKIEDGIKAVLAKHKKDQRAFVGEYTSLAAVTIAKLAIRKGYEINIDHPFLPKELLPIKELDNYEGYDFFKDLVL